MFVCSNHKWHETFDIQKKTSCEKRHFSILIMEMHDVNIYTFQCLSKDILVNFGAISALLNHYYDSLCSFLLFQTHPECVS